MDTEEKKSGVEGSNDDSTATVTKRLSSKDRDSTLIVGPEVKPKGLHVVGIWIFLVFLFSVMVSLVVLVTSEPIHQAAMRERMLRASSSSSSSFPSAGASTNELPPNSSDTAASESFAHEAQNALEALNTIARDTASVAGSITGADLGSCEASTCTPMGESSSASARIPV